MIRPATEDDLDFLIFLAKSRYPAFHVSNAREWLLKAMSMDNHLVLIGDGCAGVCVCHSYFYNPSELRAAMLYFVSKPGSGWAPYKLLKSMVDWSMKERGAASFHIGEDTGVDFSPFAKRLGMALDRPAWVLRGQVHS